MNKELFTKTFRNTTGAVVYIFIISQIMQNGERIFGSNNSTLGPLVILLLFSLSAAVVGGLIFGQSVMLFLESKRVEGVKAAIYSIAWLGAYTIFGLLTLLILK